MKRGAARIGVLWLALLAVAAWAQEARPVSLSIRPAGASGVRVTVRPEGMTEDFVRTPVLAAQDWPAAVLDVDLRTLREEVTAEVGQLRVAIAPEPLAVTVRAAAGRLVQRLVFAADHSVAFRVGDGPVLGLGEGGPVYGEGVDWRQQPVEFDRRGRLHEMRPRWQAQAYGSRNPVALLLGTGGWALYVPLPWGRVDLSDAREGRFLPLDPATTDLRRQDFGDQQQQRGKGLPPAEAWVTGYFDGFVFDAADPTAVMRDLAALSGPAVLPPKWALGYMQSHRTLEDDAQMVRIVDTFRAKRLPLDAVIYLGTGFTPRGWNTRQPSFEFNPEVFQRDPAAVLADLHERHVKVVLHMVPWARDRLPTLRGAIPPAPTPGEEEEAAEDPGQLADYWRQHEVLVAAGVDGWWPDEGDWFDLFERMKRHQLYHEGPLATRPGVRPWSLHRNGHLGVARWGGWIWSGDTDSTWKSLEAQIAVGINHSLSVSPWWGSDIGGFFPTAELDGELYARWFQFGAFCPSFRAHGRTWWTRLPWGWGLPERGPLESGTPPLPAAMNNPAIEPIARRYAELRYRLLPYNYSLAWQARAEGLPLMRALWLHHPDDPRAAACGDAYLWGRDLLVAPVYEKGATTRDVYLPAGAWYDWWTGEKHEGGRTITRAVDLATLPLFVRAGAIMPLDPVRQYTAEPVTGPTTLRIYPGADGRFTFYDDDGVSLDYLHGAGATEIELRWDDAARTLTLRPAGDAAPASRDFVVELATGGRPQRVTYAGAPVAVILDRR